MTYYAHSPKGDVPAQSYTDHVNNVTQRALCYADDVCRYATIDCELLRDVLESAAPVHDFGKLDSDNQTVLSGAESTKIKALPKNHVDAGTAYFLNEDHVSVLAAVIIHAHHLGFANFMDESNRGEKAFRDADLMGETDKNLPEFEAIHKSLIKYKSVIEDRMPSGDLAVFLRLALSCLVDADHTDTAVNYGYYPDTENIIPLRAGDRLDQLDKYIAGLGVGNDCERADLRRKMYLKCRDSNISSNICSCDSPVGSGKTTAVMAHILAQAQKRGLRRVFVVLPFTNIIRQSVDIYRHALVLPGENPEDVVAELHHRADFESEDARHLTALWRAPIIVTTAVAFFETLASNSTSTLRRLHELPGSAIFMDESHAALPATLLPIAWKWMNIYANEWNCYWLLASGSLCRFWNIGEIANATPIAPVPEIVDDDLRIQLLKYEKERIEYKYNSTPKSLEELAEWIITFSGPRLVILNTVQNAAVLADYLREHFGRECVEHLSTALTANDRDKTLERVKARLAVGEDTNWTFVATSCVEAGVDLSFRTGFRELGSLVSLLQAAGRINREGRYEHSEIWTFCLAEGGLFNINLGQKNAAAVLKDIFVKGMTISPDLSTKSIEDEIKRYGLSSKHKNLMRDENNRCFPEVEKYFEVIDTNTRIAVVDTVLSDRIRNGDTTWRELQKHSVQIAEYKLAEVHAPEIVDGIFHWNLGYDDFLGYMKGIVQLKKFEEAGMIL
jgi:CRISPR-associated endonuclease Cas3-HD